MPIITIFTPAYNRAHTLPRTYESLLRQSNKDFVWLVIDDGSSDNTYDLVKEWQSNDNGFEIIYVYKENGGMHTAHNAAYEIIDTELNCCIDSDDYMTDDAVEKILLCWAKNGSEKYSGIIALNITINGEVIGTQLPENVFSTSLSGFYRNGGKGDKKLIYRTDVMKKYPPYPEFEGEKYVGLNYKYKLADLDYELIILNEAVCVVEYQPDGSSRNMFRQYFINPKGFAFLRLETIKISKSHKEIFRNSIHYVSSAIISKDKNFINKHPKKVYLLLSMPFGAALYFYLKFKSRKERIIR